ncbi:MAG: FG-GAP repeat protein, partial [Myxococcota bacterium]
WFAESGYTREEGATEDGEMEPYAWFGWDVAVDTEDRHLLIGARTSSSYFQVGAFPFPAEVTARPQENVGLLVPSREMDYPLFTTNLGVAYTLRGERLWTSTYPTNGPSAFSGEVYTFDLPLTGARDEQDAVAVYRADAGDYVKTGAVSWSDDLDGDGVPDLVIGAHARNEGTGVVAILSDPPDGDHRVWDLAHATVDGVVAEGRLGDQVATGDLDDDGIAELLTGAAAVYGASTFHAFLGPLAGARLASSSEWTIHGEDGIERLGVSSAAADLDGDGSTDLVVGRPGNPALGIQDGSVLLFRGPVAPGVYDSADADIVVRNAQPPGTGDFFGYVLRTGDLNGDGAHELVISAPDDVEGGRPVGSVHVLYGRPELFAL